MQCRQLTITYPWCQSCKPWTQHFSNILSFLSSFLFFFFYFYLYFYFLQIMKRHVTAVTWHITGSDIIGINSRRMRYVYFMENIWLLRSLTMDLTFIFRFYFILFFIFLFFSFSFLEQLRLGFISHAVILVTSWWCSHKTDHGTWEKEVEGSRIKWHHTAWTTHAGLMSYIWSFRVGCTVVSMDHG